MTEAQLDLAHKLVSELAMYANAAQQYGHGGMTAAMRNASSLLQQMVDEYELVKAQEALATAKSRRDDRSPSAVWRNATAEHDDG